MRWLIAMECSAVIRDALRRRGHDAWSCDVKPCEADPRWHIQANVFSHAVIKLGWDGMIAHPDCTFLTKSGARHMSIPWRKEAMMAAVYNVRALWAFPIKRIAIENPSGRLSTLWRKPDQTIQPWQFGHPEFKGTCWWLKGLPLLQPTNVLEVPERDTSEHDRWSRVHREAPGAQRATNRARTLTGIAEAIADQWGAVSEPGHSLAQQIELPGYSLGAI